MSRIEALKDEVRQIMKDVPPHHGWEHGVEVLRFSKMLAYTQSGDSDTSMVAAILHDLRKWSDKELKARKIRVSWGRENEDGVNARSLVEKYRSTIFPWRPIFTSSQKDKYFWKAFSAYRDVLQSVKESSELPNKEKPARLSTEILRDADRLSRTGLIGLRSILEANQDYKVPFYNDGGDVVRQADEHLLPFDKINSCVDDINFCIDWEKIMEIDAGRILMPILGRTNRIFLEVFDNHKDIKDYNIWNSWLSSIIKGQAAKRLEVNAHIENNEYDKFLLGRINLEDPELLSEGSLQNYLSSIN